MTKHSTVHSIKILVFHKEICLCYEQLAIAKQYGYAGVTLGNVHLRVRISFAVKN